MTAFDCIWPHLSIKGSMGYWTLLKQNPRTIGFGFLNAFFSGFGQTHFISIFSPVIMAQFSLSNTEYGSLYSLITLISGFVITFIGPLIDRYNLRYFSLFIGIGLIISQTLLLSAQNIFFVGLSLFGLRFFGQGLCSSISNISISRYFHAERGKALSLTQMGYPFYEGLITPLFAFLLSFVSLKSLSLSLIIAVCCFYIPLCFSLTRNIFDFNKPTFDTSKAAQDSIKNQRNWNRKQVFTNKTIYFLLIQVLMPPFALTGLFFHQAAIAEYKDWSLSLMATGLIFFASGRIINTFITGPLVDKYKATTLFPFYQVPMALGFLSLLFLSSHWAPAISFSLFGLTTGSGGPIKSAIWAELYGVKHLGAIKSSFATIMILSTAISPALFGYIIDMNQSITLLLSILFTTTCLAGLLSLVGLRLFRKDFNLNS